MAPQHSAAPHNNYTSARKENTHPVALNNFHIATRERVDCHASSDCLYRGTASEQQQQPPTATAAAAATWSLQEAGLFVYFGLSFIVVGLRVDLVLFVVEIALVDALFVGLF